MDIRTGQIYSPDFLKEFSGQTEIENLEKSLIEMKINPTQKQLDRNPPRVGKYDLCPCNSGKKFKWCCFNKEEK